MWPCQIGFDKHEHAYNTNLHTQKPIPKCWTITIELERCRTPHCTNKKQVSKCVVLCCKLSGRQPSYKSRCKRSRMAKSDSSHAGTCFCFSDGRWSASPAQMSCQSTARSRDIAPSIKIDRQQLSRVYNIWKCIVEWTALYRYRSACMAPPLQLHMVSLMQNSTPEMSPHMLAVSSYIATR